VDIVDQLYAFSTAGSEGLLALRASRAFSMFMVDVLNLMPKGKLSTKWN
jgi:hypothetical protein